MATTDPALIQKPRRVSRRGWVIVAAIAVVVAFLYGLVAVFYNVEGSARVTGDPSVTSDGIQVLVEPVSVDVGRNQATLHLSFVPEGASLTDDQGRLLSNTRVAITTATGSDEVRFPAGEVMGQKEVLLGIDGEQALYPFDEHAGTFVVLIDTYTRHSDGTFTSTGIVNTTMAAGGGDAGWGVNGWDTTLDVANTPASTVGTFTFNRAFSTQVFALVLLALVVILAGIALTVGILVVTERRRAEIGLMAYAASLLFALPVLRNYMPNSPPIGAAIDVFVYLWVIVMAIVAVTLVVTGWIGQSRVILLAERRRAKQAAEVVR